MRLSAKKVREQVDRVAEGSPVPAGTDPAETEAPPRPSARERGAMRRRARRLRRSREVLLLELGALVFESERRGHRDAGLVTSKVERLTRIDEEARALAEALADDRPLVELVSAGVAGTCAHCGTLLFTEAHFCSNCGASSAWRPEPQSTEAQAAGDASAGGAAVAPSSSAATAPAPRREQQGGTEPVAAAPEQGAPDDPEASERAVEAPASRGRRPRRRPLATEGNDRAEAEGTGLGAPGGGAPGGQSTAEAEPARRPRAARPGARDS